MHRAAFLVLLAGCQTEIGSGLPDTDSDTDSDTDAAVHTDGDTEVPDMKADEVIARGIIAGTIDARQGLHDVAWSNGWPVHTEVDTYIYLMVADEGSWGWAGAANDWTADPMNTDGHGVWWVERVSDTPQGDAYKFVRDGETFIADPMARAYTYDDFGQLSYVRPPTDRPHLERWPELSATGLADRDLRIYVPAGTGPWPVMYMHDGQNLFDPNAIFGGWKMDAAVATDGRDVLLVGIDNGGVDRLDEYGHTLDQRDGVDIGGKGTAYADLVHDVIRPHIEKEYATSGLNGVMGSSMGGLISLHTALQHPASWDFVGSMSGSLWFGRAELANLTMEELWVTAGKQDIVVYVDSGGSDGGDGCTDPNEDGFPVDDPNDADGYCMTRSFADALAAQGYGWDETLWHWHEPGAAHNEAAWAARVGRPLGIFLDLASP